MDDDDSIDSVQQECPVCGKFFAMSVLTRHVNDCLNNTSTPAKSTRKRRVDDTAAAWGSLLPALSAGTASRAKRGRYTAAKRTSKTVSPRDKKNTTPAKTIVVTVDDESKDDFISSSPQRKPPASESKSKPKPSASRKDVASEDRYPSLELIEESSSNSSHDGDNVSGNVGTGSKTDSRKSESSGSDTEFETENGNSLTSAKATSSPKKVSFSFRPSPTEAGLSTSPTTSFSFGSRPKTSENATTSFSPKSKTSENATTSSSPKSRSENATGCSKLSPSPTKCPTKDANKPTSSDAPSFCFSPNPAKPGPAGPKISLSSLCLSTRLPDGGSKGEQFVPLAEQMRPLDLESYVGQESTVGDGTLLRSLLQKDNIPSMILWGPPGCGKTTLARIIAHRCKTLGKAKFMQLSATNSGVNEVREVIKAAKGEQTMFRRKTILFLDEIHRFNKTQQDSLLPHVESGIIVLIGATTENPSFQVNSALLSRCRVIVLEKLSAASVRTILERAVTSLGLSQCQEGEKGSRKDSPGPAGIAVQCQALDLLSQLVDGDARAALNCLQMAVQSRMTGPDGQSDRSSTENSDVIDSELIKSSLQRAHVLYDKTGEEHYNIISALHKSIRGSDSSAALYWLARMLEGGEDPRYVARRLVRAASEDIGLADPAALTLAISTQTACQTIGMPECEVVLAQCAVYLARAPKSVEVYKAYGKAKSSIKQHKGPLPSVPLHLRNAPTRLMKNLGYGRGYLYNPDHETPVDQQYMPDGMEDVNFFD